MKTSEINNTKDFCYFEIKTDIITNEIIITSKISSENPDSNTTTVITQNFTIKNPKLWSMDSPTLYTYKTQILDNNLIIDENIERFGILIIEVYAKRGFRINKIETKLRGACIHHDNGLLGR